jgi:prenylcysteine oxidase / farnesylcysteine lyase
MYDAPTFPYANLTNTSQTLGLTDITNTYADVSPNNTLIQEYLKEKGIGELFAHDFIQAATRVPPSIRANSGQLRPKFKPDTSP